MSERIALYLQDAHELRDGLDYVRYAESRGFEAVWQAESRLVRDAIVPMAAYAAVTEHIKVGSGVINNWTRNIGLLAATFLTLDDLAPNRIICGIGAWWDPLASNVGIHRHKPSTAMRETVVGNALFSPFPFHSVYSVEDHKKHVDWIKAINPQALVSVKVSTPTDVDMVAVGSYYAGAHIIHLDGSYGGTGAAPDIAKKNIAMPIEYAIGKVHNFLDAEGVRDKVTLIASGGIRTAYDVAKAIALGADGVIIGTMEMVALGCVRCGRCSAGQSRCGLPRRYFSDAPSACAVNRFVIRTKRLRHFGDFVQTDRPT